MLFVDKPFTSHSGKPLTWKIDCDALTDEDLACIAKKVAEKFLFGKVHGIPRGGARFADALRPYANTVRTDMLIVDDVLTLGQSMTTAKEYFQGQGMHVIGGVVIFSRLSYALLPRWITPVFQLSDDFAIEWK